MAIIALLLASLIVKAFSIPLQPRGAPPSKSGYRSTFIETFPGNANTLPSSSNWLIDTGTGYPGGPSHWGNSESQVYTNSLSNLQITSDHTLKIIPLHANNQWTSARIETARNDFAAAPGGKLLIEARIKLGDAPASSQKGIWPGFWALGAAFRGDYHNWPMVGETDFLEGINGEPLTHNVIHCGFDGGTGGPCNEYTGIANAVDMSRGQWHTVTYIADRTASSWKDETLTWLLDGKQSFQVNGARVGDEGAWGKVAHDAKFLLLNVAVGGNWAGSPNAQTTDGEKVGMEVDYLGVWNSI